MLTPEDRARIRDEENTAAAKRHLEMLKSLVDAPPIAMRKADSAAELQSYQRRTIPEEVPLVTNPAYLEASQTGQALPPLPMMYYPAMQGKKVPWFPLPSGGYDIRPMGDPNMAQQLTGEMPIEEANPWAIWWALPKNEKLTGWTPFTYHQKRFIQLIEDLGRRIEAQRGILQ